MIKNLTQGTALRQITYYKVATGSEPASYTWSLGTSRAASGGHRRLQRRQPDRPDRRRRKRERGKRQRAAPSVTTSAANDQVIAVASFALGTTRYARPEHHRALRRRLGLEHQRGCGFRPGERRRDVGEDRRPRRYRRGAWIAQTVALREASQATLAVSSTAAPSFSANLNSGDQAKTYTVPLTLNDTRTGAGAGLGWNTTITSTHFTSGAKTLPATASTVTAVSSACANGGLCTNPTNSITYPVAVPAGAGPPPR